MQVFTAIGFGLVTASVIALAAVGLTLQFGITNFVNFAYGDFLTVGAYFAYLANAPLHQNIIISLVVAALLTGLFALAVNEVLLQPFLRDKPKIVIMLIVTIGLSLILENLLQLIFGPDFYIYTLPGSFSTVHYIGPFLFSSGQLAIIAVALLALLGLYLLLQHTKVGKAMRAMSDSQELAQASGIDTVLVTRLTWFISGALAGIAGVVLALNVNTITPTMGFTFLFVIFAAVIMGGIGRPLGALLSALVLGLVIEISGMYLDAAYKQAMAFAILLIILLIRPNGIFAARGRN